MKNILLTGGHAGSTAHAVIQAIRKYEKDTEILFVGSVRAFEGKNIPTLESVYLPKYGIKYIPIIMGKLKPGLSLRFIISLFKLPIGIVQALLIVNREKPSIILSFGGFSSFPVVIAGWAKGIPIIIHEQTAAAGKANIYSAIFARKIAVSRKESIKYFPINKCVLTGNPISYEICQQKKRKVGKRYYSLLITGGSRGSRVINDTVKKILPKILKTFTVYHQTGYTDYKEFKQLEKLPLKSYRKKYHVYSILEITKMHKLLGKTDIIISRSGANTVSEVIHLGIPSIFIPLPRSYYDEQEKNANIGVKLGLSIIIKENDLTPSVLYNEIVRISKNWNFIVSKSKRPAIDDSKASEKVYKLIKLYAKDS